MQLRSSRDTSQPPQRGSALQRRATEVKRNATVQAYSEPETKKRRKAKAPPVSEVPSTSSHPSPSSAHDENKSKEVTEMRQTAGGKTRRRVSFECARAAARNINEMPEHILVSVFTLLPIADRVKAERVCRKWRYLSRGFSWSSTDTFSFSTLMKSSSTNRVTNERPLIGDAEVSVFTLLPIADRVKAERVCRKWRYLSRGFSWSSTDTFSFSTLMKSSSTNRVTNERPLIGDAEVKSLAARCGNYLRHMDLHAFRDTLSYSVCRSFAPLCPNLISLNLCGIQLTNSAVQLLGRHCPNLEEVNFHRCFQESVVERGLSSFFNKCVRLRAVDVGENERLSGIPSFETLPGTLATLKVGGCYRLTGDAMEAIKNRCPNLTYLMMNSVDTLSASELNSFFTAMASLRKLKFGECFISHTIGGADLNLSALKNLTELTINDNLLITDRVLRTLVNGCKQLRYVDISGCNRFVTNDGLMELAKLQYLTHLNLSMMRITSDETVKRLAERGILQAILLHRCDDITDAAVVKLLECCSHLTSLDISFCPKVTDISMRAIYTYVSTREKREKLNPVCDDCGTKRHDEHLSQLMRYERSLLGLINPDIEMLELDSIQFAVEPADAVARVSRSISKELEANASAALTELHIWIGNSGIVNRHEHPLLHIDDRESAFGERQAELFELRMEFGGDTGAVTRIATTRRILNALLSEHFCSST
ncbi:putative F-box/LRR-repeat protein C02F5.7 [Toxocara canis]|uniref:Putative F-box/LRR-repeat protein C02F5.7 n=1 Tax=Toxocara canis TaxID=6265 RepID=A0A0B2UWP5_TOXCA|nr:putative F-box/LRR-repeat protein C02F5.7 [Toxocara canis]